MKKSLKKSVSVLLSLIMVLSVCSAGFCVSNAAVAEEEPLGVPVIDAEETKTVISFDNGSTAKINNAPDVSELENRQIVENIAGYEVFYDGNSIIDVTLNDVVSSKTAIETKAPNGYYSVRFDMPDTNKEVFLTGLTPDNMDLIQEKLIDSYTSDKDFTLESFDFIDAEKTTASNDDDNLCWAGVASNLLHYTGWGAKAGYKTEDDLFDLFVDSFNDGPYFISNGLSWFFNGYENIISSFDPNDATVKEPNSGAFLPDYTYDKVGSANFFNNDYSNSIKLIKQAQNNLKDGSGVGIGVGWLNGDSFNGAHVISCWGYVNNNDYSEDVKEHYEAFIISDSDSDERADSNRRTAPNKINIIHSSPYSAAGFNTWLFNGYGSGLLYSVDSIKPYSDDLEKETSPRATKNKNSTVDFLADGINVSSADGTSSDSQKTLFSDDEIYLTAVVAKSNIIAFNGECEFSFRILNDLGNEVYTATQRKNLNTNNGVKFYVGLTDKSIRLSPGSYTAELTVNPQEEIEEAYYYNNMCSTEFVVDTDEKPNYELSVSADIADFNDLDQSEAKISYQGFDEILPDISTVELYLSYYQDENWTLWRNEKGGSQGLPLGSAPEAVASPVSSFEEDNAEDSMFIYKCSVSKIGSKVKFLVKVTLTNGKTINVYSPEYELYYSKILYVDDDKNTGTYSNLENGATKLTDGEQFCFSIKNASTYDSGVISGYYVLALSNETQTVDITDPQYFSLSYGESINSITIDSWNDGLPLSGKYSVLVNVYTDDGVFNSCNNLGTLCFREQNGIVVDTADDVSDDYDGKTSLREAVEYYIDRNLVDESITVSENLKNGCLNLNSPIKIDAKVKIDGSSNYEQGGKSYISGTYIQSYSGSLFNITDRGELNLNGLTLSGVMADYGGTVNNNGGKAEFSNVRFFNSSAKIAGGAVYSSGGILTFKNCTFKLSSSENGGAVFLTDGAKADMLNCTLFSNMSNNGIITNNSGNLNIVNSTFTENTNSASVVSNKNTNMLGCIATGNYSTYDLEGKINVYGSFIGKTDKYVTAVNCETGGIDDIFVTQNDEVEYGLIYNGIECGLLFYRPYIHDKKGISVSVKNEILEYSDGVQTFSTNIPAAFDAEDYQLDSIGDQRGCVYGSFSYVPYRSEFIGDANMDGKVNINDVTCIQKYLSEYITRDKIDLNAADVDMNGVVTIKDATCLQKRLTAMTV